MIASLENIKNFFFIGVAGSGMSAIAQYLAATGNVVSGSDRFFTPDTTLPIQQQLEDAGIHCFPQDGSGLTDAIEVVVVSTAIEPTVLEVQLSLQRNIPIIKRSELLALIVQTQKTIAIGGTSGKSTTSGMLFNILKKSGMKPSIISGAGLTSLIKIGKIGNAEVGDPNGWLIIEADESDGSIVQYHPEIGVLLNVDKDHQEVSELMHVFELFQQHSKDHFIVNKSNAAAATLSTGDHYDFSIDDVVSNFQGRNFLQDGWEVKFDLNNQQFKLKSPGKHNMENAVAAIAAASAVGVSLEDCAAGLLDYEGIYRRHQLIGVKNGVTVVDDFAHNPVKCAAGIRACQQSQGKVVAWFQPHGYAPTRFLKDDFIDEISNALRAEDEIWMSEIYYAGGTAVKDISALDLIEGIRVKGKKAFFVEDRLNLANEVRSHLNQGDVLLLMGARDPTLEQYAQQVFNEI